MCLCSYVVNWLQMIRPDYSKGSAADTCPRCGHVLKSWNDLTDEQQMLAERLPISTEFPLAQRKKHRFCTRCWFEVEDSGPVSV